MVFRIVQVREGDSVADVIAHISAHLVQDALGDAAFLGAADIISNLERKRSKRQTNTSSLLIWSEQKSVFEKRIMRRKYDVLFQIHADRPIRKSGKAETIY